MLMKHRVIVETNIKAHKNNFSLFDKYVWIARYHNYFCDNFLNKNDFDVETLKIDSTLMNKQIVKNF